MPKNKQLNPPLHSAATLRTVSVLALLCLLNSTARADRPAMEGRTEAIDARSETQGEESQPAGPSAVELMIQQQNQSQQTGDILQMQPQEIQPGQTLKVQLLDTPRRGASMDRVQQELGQPISISDSVGQPPITRWTYPDRIVYFEYSSVIHVVKR